MSRTDDQIVKLWKVRLAARKKLLASALLAQRYTNRVVKRRTARVAAAKRIIARHTKPDTPPVFPAPPPERSLFGIDYAWGKPNYDTLRKANVHFVCRYISHDGGKDLFKPELAELRKREIAVALVFESTANRALAGFNAGHVDGQFAKARLEALGVKGPVYFAVDFDANDAQKPVIAAYLHGAASVLGASNVGVYGGYYVVKYMHEHKVCSWFWQTLAWSGGQVHKATHIYQFSNGHTLAGVSCDFNHGMTSGVGSVR